MNDTLICLRRLLVDQTERLRYIRWCNAYTATRHKMIQLYGPDNISVLLATYRPVGEALVRVEYKTAIPAIDNILSRIDISDALNVLKTN